jgi:hypothetical protein
MRPVLGVVGKKRGHPRDESAMDTAKHVEAPLRGPIAPGRCAARSNRTLRRGLQPQLVDTDSFKARGLHFVG